MSRNGRSSKRYRAGKGLGRKLRLEKLEDRRLLAVSFNLLKDVNLVSPSSNPAAFSVVGSELFLVANDGTSGEELWKSDGTVTGTIRVKDINTGYSLANVDGALYFVATDGPTGAELWKSDGTEGGTVRVKDIRGESFGSSPELLTNVGGTLYFSANDGVSGYELWKSDGTEAGTIRVKNIRTGSASSWRSALKWDPPGH